MHVLSYNEDYSLLQVGAIYDITVGIDPKGPKPDLNTVRCGVGLKGQLFVRRIPFSSVPVDEEKSAHFLYQLYKQKVSRSLFAFEHDALCFIQFESLEGQDLRRLCENEKF